jgi:hypothetical protein
MLTALSDINDRRLREHLAGRMTLAELAAGMHGNEPYRIVGDAVEAIPPDEYRAAMLDRRPPPAASPAAPCPGATPAAQTAGARYEAVRAEVMARPDGDPLRTLMAATDALLGRNPQWTACQRAARHRSFLAQHDAAKAAPLAPAPADPIDLVVPLGTGSSLDDLELRYLLRSARANLRGLRTIHIIGPRRPAWLADHPQIRWHDWRQTAPKNHDIVGKFLAAATSPDVTEAFVGSCDDWLFLRPVDMVREAACTGPSGTLSDNRQGSAWQRACAGTRQVLLAAGRPVRFYDDHVPTVMTKAGWTTVDRAVAWRSVPGHGVWSLYHNTAGVHGPTRDRRAFGGWHSGQAPKSVADVEQALAGKLWGRYNDRGFNQHTRAWLAARLPDPAPWESQAETGTSRLPGASAVFCAFNAPYADMAAAMVHSALETCSGWIVHAYATNVPAAILAAYPWTDPRVAVHSETRQFAGREAERCYMNSRRFLRYQDVLRSGAVDFAVMLDVDQIVLRPLDDLRKWMLHYGADIGLVECPREADDRRRVRACTVASRTSPAALAYWAEFERRLHPEDRHEWYADQLALLGAQRATAGKVAVMPMAERNYSAFKRTDRTYVLVTSTQHKTLRSRDWVAAYTSAGQAVSARRAATARAAAALASAADRTAAVYAVFGEGGGARHDAIVSALTATAATVAMPARTILLELSATPTLAAVLAAVPGLTYRHIQTPPRGVGVWQKEALWEIARRMLATQGGIRFAAFIDADTAPVDPAWFSLIQAAHAGGIKCMQPWRRCTDPLHGDIGGLSDSWLLQHTGADRSAQSGFAWSFDLDWLESIGGLPCVEPLGGGDNLLRNVVYPAIGRFNSAAVHIPALAAASTVPRQTPRSLDVDLIHHSHGPRCTRQYDIRYRVAALATSDIMALHERHPTGVWTVREGPLGDAWLRMLAIRDQWSADDSHNAALWADCQRPTPAEVPP